MFGLSVTRLSLAGLGHAPSIRLSNLGTGLKGSAAQHSWTCYRLVEQCDKAKLDFRYNQRSGDRRPFPFSGFLHRRGKFKSLWSVSLSNSQWAALCGNHLN